MNIGLLKAAVFLPQQFESAEYISKQSGIPCEVIENKMGIIKKCRAPKELQPSTMAIEAAKSALQGIDPLSVDMLIWTGSEYKDHPVWSAGIFVQQELGLKNAFAFDLAARCSSNVVGLKVAKAMMESDPTLKRVLLCGGHKTGDLVNYNDANSRFLYNLSDGGSAMLLEQDGPNPILASKVITDGAFSKDVIIPVGGTQNSPRQDFLEKDTYLQVPDIKGMRERLAEKSIHNFMQVIKDAAQTSMSKPIDYLALLHMKRSAHDTILEQLELDQQQSIYMDHYGHFGAPDQVLSLGLAERKKRLKKNDHVVMASAGIGYTWSALSIKWEQPCFEQSTLDQFEYNKETI
jgi:3-oxoacyl-[acyl-carrier-protein] synthase III